MNTPTLVPLALLMQQGPAARPDITPDKSSYTLFNPTPRELMRPMNTDRPDATESPYTVDAGHVQLELSFAEWTRDDDAGASTESWSILPFNFKLGLTSSTDLQLVIAPYEFVDTESTDSAEGFGDTTVRLKVNLWGNDGGANAFALMPFITLPTGDDELSTNHVEGGLILPLAVELPHGFSLGLMAELDLVWNDGDDQYELDLVHTATLGRDILGNLAGFVEYVGVTSTNSNFDYQSTANVGLTFDFTTDLRFDTGMGFGLTDSADDLRIFAGMSVRF